MLRLCQPVGRALRHHRVEQGRLVDGFQLRREALAHHRIAALQRLPGFVQAAQVFQFLVARELEGGVVFAAALDLGNALGDEVQMIVGVGPATQTRQRERGAAEGRAQAKAGFDLGFDFLHAAVELQLQGAEIAKVWRVQSQVAGAIHQGQRGCMQAESLLDMRQAE